MTDKEKLDAIRAEIHRLVDIRDYDREMANDLFAFMDSLPNEPISEDLKEAARRYAALQAGMKDAMTSKFYEEYPYSPNDVNAFKAGANWGRNQAMAEIQAQSMALAHGCPKEESVSEDLEKEVRKYAPIYYKDNDISKFARHFANWQKEKDDKLLQDHVVYKKGKESGMRYMKQQMMAKAVDAHCFGFQGDALFSFKLPAYKYLVGSEVKVIVIKKD